MCPKMAAYHSNLDEVKAATDQISIDLAALYAQAQQAWYPSAGAFAQWCTVRVPPVRVVIRDMHTYPIFRSLETLWPVFIPYWLATRSPLQTVRSRISL